ncbi:hypothetical protein [Azospirillum argentinense]|uniref:DUF4280 domain-containing protein n=1 Tax=Azospirillum argentinense TaxID=2970906 RepID=UPI0032DEE332
MPMQVVNGATLQCSFGMAPSTFVVLPVHRTMAGNQPAANIMDHQPMVNILPFGMCTSLANPAVASATAAAMGALTPMPCVPNTPAPWVPGAPTVILDSAPALDTPSKCMCVWAGVISIANPGQTTTMIP